MTKTRKNFAKKLLAFFVAVLTLITVVGSLASCGGATQQRWNRGSEESDIDFVAKIIVTDANWTYTVLAAHRGYDLNDIPEGTEDFPKLDLIKTEPVKRVLGEIISKNRFENDSDKQAVQTIMDNLNTTDVTAIVESSSFKQSPNPSAEVGFPAIILVWIGQALGAITSVVGGNYIWALIIFALVLELLMFPLAFKQQKNTIGMAKLRPMIAKIEKKYAGRYDRATQQKKQQEIMDLQQKSGYSAMSGCLPMLIQLIVVGFILYPIIQNPLYYMLGGSDEFANSLMLYAGAPEAAGGLGYSLSSRNVMEVLSIVNSDNIAGIQEFALFGNGAELFQFYSGLNIPDFSIFGLNLGLTPTIAFPFTVTSWLLLVPLLNVVAQFISMQLTKKWNGAGDPSAMANGNDDAQNNASMKLMNWVGPLLTLFVMFQVPAMIGVYWLFRTILSIGTRFILKLVLPVPKYTEEEIREMEKADKERQRAQREIAKEAKFRSLHYIDEDDYEELPEVTTKDGDTKKPNNSFSDMPEIKD